MHRYNKIRHDLAVSEKKKDLINMKQIIHSQTILYQG
jgi:hypothetical protein